MKRFRIFGAAFFVVCVVCALDVVAASPAMAEVCVELLETTSLWMLRTNGVCEENLGVADGLFELVTFLLALWLVNGSEVTSELTVEGSGELLLEDTGTGVAILCSGIGNGWVGPNSLGWGSELLTLEKTAVKELVDLEALLCVTQAGTCEDPLLWAVNLPYEGEVELWETATALIDNRTSGFVVLGLPHAGGGNPGWEIDCMNFILVEDTCTGPEGVVELLLEGATLLADSSEDIVLFMGLKLANCSVGGAETGNLEGEGSIVLAGGGELTASSETAVS